MPYAGGISEFIYSNWKRVLINEKIEIVPIELSGRGKRSGESNYNSIKEAVEDIYNYICNDFKGKNYAIFGHSMGGLLTYELTKKIEETNIKKPKHIFVSGRAAAEFCPTKKERSMMSMKNGDFINEILKLEGTSKSIFQNEELRNIFLPILRNDYFMIGNYIHDFKKINTPITVMHGESDTIEYENVKSWKNYTNSDFDIKTFEGGHFFIREQRDEILDVIKSTLLV